MLSSALAAGARGGRGRSAAGGVNGNSSSAAATGVATGAMTGWTATGAGAEAVTGADGATGAAWGAGSLTTGAATDVSPARLELARAFGASLAVDLGAADAEQQLRAPQGAEATAPFLGYDAVFEVCGVAAAVRQAVPLLRPGGALVLVGLVHPKSDLGGLTAEAVIRKCATLVGVHNYAPEDLAEAVDFLDAAVGEGVLPLHRLTSPPVPLAELPRAVELAKTGGFARVLVVPGAPDMDEPAGNGR